MTHDPAAVLRDHDEALADALRIAHELRNMTRKGLEHIGIRWTKYTCANKRRCTALSAWELPDGRVLVYMPRYTLSEAMNAATTSESGRRANTEDGNRKWRERAVWLRKDWPEQGFDGNCDHMRRSLVSSQQVLDDLANGRKVVHLR